MTNPPPEDLKNRIKHARKKAGLDEKKETGASSAFAVSADLLSGVAVGSFIGYFLDKWLGTTPILFLICFFLGAIAGGYNIYRAAQRDASNDESEK